MIADDVYTTLFTATCTTSSIGSCIYKKKLKVHEIIIINEKHNNIFRRDYL